MEVTTDSVLPTPLCESVLLTEPVDVQSNHRLTEISRDFSKDLGVIEMSHSLRI